MKIKEKNKLYFIKNKKIVLIIFRMILDILEMWFKMQFKIKFKIKFNSYVLIREESKLGVVLYGKVYG